MGLSHSPSIVTDGLVLCVDAINKKSYSGSGTSVIDLVRTQSNGTIYGNITYSNGTFVGGTTGSASIDIPHSNSLNVSNQISVSVWASGDNLYIYAGLIGKPSTSFWEDAWGFYLNQNPSTSEYYLRFYINVWDAVTGPGDGVYVTHVLDTSGIFPLTNYTATYDGANVKLYVNGNLTDQASYTANIRNTTQPLRLLNLTGGYYFPSDSTLSVAQIYNRGLTETEVKQNFNALRGRFGL